MHSPHGAVQATATFWLLHLLQAAVIVILAVGLPALRRRRRPEPTAAIVGLVGSLALYAMPWFHLFKGAAFPAAMFWFAEYLLTIAAPLVLACWLGANLCRAWWGFWQGPGGAILRGGIAAWLVGLPIVLALHHWANAALLRAQPMAHLPGYGSAIAHSLHNLPLAALVTAVLVSSRPSRLRGGLAGAVLALAAVVVSLVALMSMTMTGIERAPRADPGVLAAGLIATAILGGVAGSFAGTWKQAVRIVVQPREE